jgi:cardiolipin synthase A/B
VSATLTSGYAVAVTAVHVVLAAGVTVHALNTKRDPASAVAWVGLAWLSPVVGSVLYLLLGINRVRRRARTMRAADDGSPATPAAQGHRPDHFAPLATAGLRITSRLIVPGNAFEVLSNGDVAYPRMIAAIDSASASVGLQTYIFRADAVGKEFIAALVRAQERGVAVRVLIDGVGGGYFWTPAYRRLRAAGVPAARFLHSALPWRMPFLNLRAHRKLLIVDGCLSFTGGLNIGAENVLASHPRRPVSDTHFLVKGPVVAQLSDAFADQWRFASGESLTGERWRPTLKSAGECAARVVTSGPDQDLEKIELLILEAVACARHTIRIMTPYFLPDDRLITALALAAMRQVDVEVVLPEHSNHPSVDCATRAHIGPLLDAGCRIWVHGPPFDHGKLMTVDGQWSLVGSSNWDTRSFRLNFEINLEVYSHGLAARLDENILARRGRQLTGDELRGRSWAVQLRDSAARLMLPYL